VSRAREIVREALTEAAREARERAALAWSIALAWESFGRRGKVRLWREECAQAVWEWNAAERELAALK
jgi:hypothetical protein